MPRTDDIPALMADIGRARPKLPPRTLGFASAIKKQTALEKAR